MEYVTSVFGEGVITRQQLIEHYAEAERTWYKIDIPLGLTRDTIKAWCKAAGIGGLHYYAPYGHRHVFFKEQQDVFAYRLRWG